MVKERETQISTFINCGMQEPSGLTSRVVWATHQYVPGLGAAKAPLARAQCIVKGGSWKHWGKYGTTDNSVKPTSLSFPAYSEKIRGSVSDYFTQHQSIAYFISSTSFSGIRIPLRRQLWCSNIYNTDEAFFFLFPLTREGTIWSLPFLNYTGICSHQLGFQSNVLAVFTG